jgi:hypothetical protein
MLDVIKKKVMDLSIVFERDFNGGNLLGQSAVSLKLISPPVQPTELYVFVSFNFSAQSMTDEFKITAEISMVVGFNEKSKVKNEDLFNAITVTHEHLQSIVNSIFSTQNSAPIVSPIEYDDISDTLDEHIQSLA